MVPALQSSTSTKDANHLVFKPLKMDFSARYLVDSPNPSNFTMHNSTTNASNAGDYTPPVASISGTSVDDLPARSCFTMHLHRVVTVDRHDIDAWTRERNVHDSELNAVAVSTSLGSPDDPSAVNTRSFALMELQTGRSRTIEQLPNTGRLSEVTTTHPHNWSSPVAPYLGISVRNDTAGPCSREYHSWGRPQVGDILCHRGVFDNSRMSPIESTAVGDGHNVDVCPVTTVIPGVTAELRCGEDEQLIAALTDWTSKWIHMLVVQPYIRGNFPLRYQGSPTRGPASVATRIRRVLDNVENPVQVVIHTLWFIGILMGNGAGDNGLFLSVPILRYLHNNGASIAEDFMFRTFVACAMISDKTVNDAALTTYTWNRLTRIPQAILNATEKYTLSCLEWNVVMTWTQWQDTIIYLRSNIKMSSVFDPFSYDRSSPSSIMACHLDQLINLSDADEVRTPQEDARAVEILSPQPVRHFTHWEIFSTAEWCPEDDPVVNERPRTIGIAPGAGRNTSTFELGTTAKDLLDSILGSRNIPHLTHLAQPAGTSFCGSFGVIGARLAHTIRIASTCQSAWVPSHG